MNPSPTTLAGKIVAGLASLRLTVFGLIVLLVLTVWGTLYQADHGLYQAQERFYQSWIFLVGGWLPLPGAQLVMSALFLNMAASFLRVAGAGRLHWGYILTHGGLVLMLVAGAVTFLFGARSQLFLLEGHGSNVSASQQEWELAAWRTVAAGQDREVSAVDLSALRPGMSFSLSGVGLAVTIETIHANCEAQRTPNVPPAEDLVSITGAADLNPLPREKEPGNNRPGMVMAYAAADGTQGRVLLHVAHPNPTELKLADGSISLALRRKVSLLPAVIRLLDFQKELYPGSQVARKFASRISLRDGDLEREVMISMNKPLRYRGFTFYQSSYKELSDGREASLLAVVKNRGRLMPYVATFMTALGMMVHFAGRLVMRLRNPAGGNKETA